MTTSERSSSSAAATVRGSVDIVRETTVAEAVRRKRARISVGTPTTVAPSTSSETSSNDCSVMSAASTARALTGSARRMASRISACSSIGRSSTSSTARSMSPVWPESRWACSMARARNVAATSSRCSFESDFGEAMAAASAARSPVERVSR